MKYYSVNEYLKDTFGSKIYKISLDGGFTCPNRDGTIGTGGCIFCDGGSGSFAQSCTLSITEQIEAGKALVINKLPAGKSNKFIAYFQSYTGTYGETDRLRTLYLEAANHPDIAVVSVATRPDCISPEIITILREIQEIKPVWIELGLQTIHESTAEFIKRGYTLDVYDNAVSLLQEANIDVITHMIIGLPGEDIDMMRATASYIGKSGAKGIKLQLLHILKDTYLAKLYSEGKAAVMTMDEYTNAVIACLKELPADMVVHRITGDGDKNRLIAPLWSTDKKRVLNHLKKEIENS